MIRAGTTSITFRKLSVRRVVELAIEARLEGIEWGGDVHVPHGDLAAAREAHKATTEAGLIVSSYGSYFRLTQSQKEGLSFHAVLDAACELHANTLTDSTDSALRLLREIAHPNLTTYWQPNYDASEAQCLDSIRRLRPHVSNVHVFHWRPHPQRRALEEGAGVWTKYLRELDDGHDRWALLEFVKDDSEQVFLEDAMTLRRLLNVRM